MRFEEKTVLLVARRRGFGRRGQGRPAFNDLLSLWPNANARPVPASLNQVAAQGRQGDRRFASSGFDSGRSGYRSDAQLGTCLGWNEVYVNARIANEDRSHAIPIRQMAHCAPAGRLLLPLASARMVSPRNSQWLPRSHAMHLAQFE